VRLATGLVTGAIPVAALRDQSSNPETQPPRFPAQVARFAAIGVASSLAYVLLYLAARVALPAQAANALALVTTAVANTAANRRFTFAIHGPDGVVRDHLRGLAVFAFVLGVTAGLLAALHAASPQPARTVEVAVLVGANLLATLLRFVLLRGWVFRSRRGCEPAVPQRSRSTS
jgi:putative flippase GtrA